MSQIKQFFESFRLRVALLLMLTVLLMGFVSDIMLQRTMLRVQFDQLKDKLRTTAGVVAAMIDAETVNSIPLEKAGIQTPAFQSIYEKFLRIKQEDPSIGFIYVLKPGQDKTRWIFVVDADPYLARKKLTAYPGDEYDAGLFPEMWEGLERPVAENAIRSDAWGTMLSGYAPIMDKNKNAVAIVGVDIMASDISLICRKIHEGILWALLTGAVLAILLGVWFSSKLTSSIRVLADGIRRISRGDLAHKINIEGHDEIAELSRSFNCMADDLAKSRQKNRDYYYGIIRSLVMIIEARDPYTRGHSERVSELAVRTAIRMGLSAASVDVLKQTAILHDIGKLGIHETILAKKEKLTETEWEVLKNHPVIGEDILRPVLLEPEMLAAVRGHHERHDGSGYPDKLSGEDIHIFARILSVVDAYDAMTSNRSYRKAMDRCSAVAELRKHSGTQFDPAVVDVFVKVLANEKKDM